MYSIAALNDFKPQSKELDRSEIGLNQWGYDPLRSNRQADAVKVFELMVALYPESSNARDSLGEGYEAVSNVAGALKSYRNALAKDPGQSTQRRGCGHWQSNGLAPKQSLAHR